MPKFPKSKGFSLRSGKSPFRKDEEETTDVSPHDTFDPRGSDTYEDYVGSFQGSEYKPRPSSWWQRIKSRYGKSGESGYTGRSELARLSQMGGTAGSLRPWEEEEISSSMMVKKSPAKASYFSDRNTPIAKKSSGYKMKGSSYKKKYKSAPTKNYKKGYYGA